MKQAWVLAALVLCACPPTEPMPDPEDAGDAPAPVFDGRTTPAGVPDFFPPYDAGDDRIDSGVIVLDTTCCDTRFSIADLEPEEVLTAKLRIKLGTFSEGVALRRDGGRWGAVACFPVNTSATFFYEFTWDGGLVDAGNRELDDGGFEPVLIGSTTVSQRASDEEPSFIDSDGQHFNLYPAVESCAGLDGSVPLP
jgi:hypothetical protein